MFSSLVFVVYNESNKMEMNKIKLKIKGRTGNNLLNGHDIAYFMQQDTHNGLKGQVGDKMRMAKGETYKVECCIHKLKNIHWETYNIYIYQRCFPFSIAKVSNIPKKMDQIATLHLYRCTLI